MPYATRPPAWFWLVALLLVAWNAFGVYVCVDQFQHGAASRMWPQDEYHRTFYTLLPSWYNYVYIVATFGGLLGSLALLLKEKRARLLFWLSLIAIVAMFGWTFAKTDMIAHEGVRQAVLFPVVITLIALFSIWFAGTAARKGWIGAR